LTVADRRSDVRELVERAHALGPQLRAEAAFAERWGSAKIARVSFGPGRVLLLADGRLWVVSGGQRVPLASTSRKVRTEVGPYLKQLADICATAP
jgi:hypothetical protein